MKFVSEHEQSWNWSPGLLLFEEPSQAKAISWFLTSVGKNEFLCFETLPVNKMGHLSHHKANSRGPVCVHMAKLFYTLKQRGLIHAAYGAWSLIHTKFPNRA